jgi:UvrD-like helicase C-terminal domain
VIQQVHDYQREVFNGDLGTIASIDLEEQEVVAQFAERQINYDYADLLELALAWAVTVHKSQGSEYPIVIFPILMQHYLLLSRNLVYTRGSHVRNNWPSWWDRPRQLDTLCLLSFSCLYLLAALWMCFLEPSSCLQPLNCDSHPVTIVGVRHPVGTCLHWS